MSPFRFSPAKNASKDRGIVNRVSQEMANAGVQRHQETPSVMYQSEPLGRRPAEGAYIDDGTAASPSILVSTFEAARESHNRLCRAYWDVYKETNEEVRRAIELHLRQHLEVPSDTPQIPIRFLFNAFFCQLFFTDFNNSSFGVGRPGQSSWTEEFTKKCFEQFLEYRATSVTVQKLLGNELDDTFISDFCTKKFEMLRTLDPDGLFFKGVLPTHEASRKFPEHPVHTRFLGAAVSIWLLQRLTFSFEDRVMLIYPEREHRFNKGFMTSSVAGNGDNAEDRDYSFEVLFTTFPGFQVGQSVLPASVHLCYFEQHVPDNDVPLYEKRRERLGSSGSVTTTTYPPR